MSFSSDEKLEIAKTFCLAAIVGGYQFAQRTGSEGDYAAAQGLNAAQSVKRIFGKDKEYAMRYLLMLGTSLGIPHPKEVKGKKVEVECNPENCGYVRTARISGVANFCPHFCDSFMRAYCAEFGISFKIEPPKNGKNGRIEYKIG
ncbi:MAG: hypothetical protein KIH08_12885 [Candidatus Freyarchaeota archaeon]|nr:hypothetical protein [Candidatus Jordarchaeia archaeon]MBS7269585.1 hypothetical protein [Candidatus Jordarchaeia archaeon]MBS7281542.1 hypothetical protein [Candidatus Jordarchaeia archaeon]